MNIVDFFARVDKGDSPEEIMATPGFNTSYIADVQRERPDLSHGFHAAVQNLRVRAQAALNREKPDFAYDA